MWLRTGDQTGQGLDYIGDASKVVKEKSDSSVDRALWDSITQWVEHYGTVG